MPKLTAVAILTALLFGACATAPRVTTEEERALARQTVTNVETALILLHATGQIEPEKYALALKNLGELRTVIEESGTNAISWPDITQRLANLTLQWIAPHE